MADRHRAGAERARRSPHLSRGILVGCGDVAGAGYGVSVGERGRARPCGDGHRGRGPGEDRCAVSLAELAARGIGREVLSSLAETKAPVLARRSARARAVIGSLLGKLLELNPSTAAKVRYITAQLATGRFADSLKPVHPYGH